MSLRADSFIIMPMLEKRCLERFELPLPAAIEVIRGTPNPSKGVICLTARNISASGAYFDTERPLEVGARVHIDLILALGKILEREERAAYVSLTGRVVRAEHQGMAVSFDPNYRIRRVDRATAARKVQLQ